MHKPGLTLLLGDGGQDAVAAVPAAVFEPLLDVVACEAADVLSLHLDDQVAGLQAAGEHAQLMGRPGADSAQLAAVRAALDRHLRLGPCGRHHRLALQSAPVLR